MGRPLVLKVAPRRDRRDSPPPFPGDDLNLDWASCYNPTGGSSNRAVANSGTQPARARDEFPQWPFEI